MVVRLIGCVVPEKGRRMRVVRFIVLVFAVVVAVMPVAAAGGSWMRTPDDFVEPGETVEFVGYVGAENADEGRWHAYLSTPQAVVALGPVTIEPTGLGGYLSPRVYLRFTVPSTLAEGSYEVLVQSGSEFIEDQRVYLGDLIGAAFEVGSATTQRPFEWPLDEPLVAALASDAVLIGPDWEITVGEVRQGLYPRCRWGCLLDTTVLRREDVTIIDAPPSWATTTAPSVTTPTSVATTSLSTTALSDPGRSTTGVASEELGTTVGRDVALIGMGILLAVAVSFVAAGRSRNDQPADPRVVEDDISEPSRV